jgi:DNA-binding transcriptional MocR family regulator
LFNHILVPSELDGLNLDNLEKQFEKDLTNIEADKAAGRYSAACYLVPTYQNPYGTILSEGLSRKPYFTYAQF